MQSCSNHASKETQQAIAKPGLPIMQKELPIIIYQMALP